MFGIGLLIVFFLMEAIRRIINGQSLHFTEAVRLYATTIPIAFVLSTAFIPNPAVDYTTLITTIFLKPVEVVVGALLNNSTNEYLKGFGDALDSYSQGNSGSSSTGSFLAIMNLSIPVIMANAFLLISLVITWVMSLYISIMCTVMLCLGPLFLPFLVFQPVSQIGWNWIRGMIAYPMMCIVGAVISTILMKTNMQAFTAQAGPSGHYITIVAASLILLIVNISVPSITNGIVGGIHSSPLGAMSALRTGAAATYAGATGAFAGAGTGGAIAGGSAAYAAGSIAERLGSFFSKRGSEGAKSWGTPNYEYDAMQSAGGKMENTGAKWQDTGKGLIQTGATFGTRNSPILRTILQATGIMSSADQPYKSFKDNWNPSRGSIFGAQPGTWEVTAAAQSTKQQNDSLKQFAYMAYGASTSRQLEAAFATGQVKGGFGVIPSNSDQIPFLRARLDSILLEAKIKPSKAYLLADSYNTRAEIQKDPFLTPEIQQNLLGLLDRLKEAKVPPEEIAMKIRNEAVRQSANDFALMNFPGYMSSPSPVRREYIKQVAENNGLNYDLNLLPARFIAYPVSGKTYDLAVLAALTNYFKKLSLKDSDRSSKPSEKASKQTSSPDIST
jgi:type IV secretory pathway TrbL component